MNKTYCSSRIWPQLFAAVFFVALPLCAQTDASGAETTPAANPARPTVTNPATLPPVGYLQFEQGYLGSLNSPETDTQYGVNQVTKLAVHPRLMFQVQTQPFAASTVNGTPGVSHDTGDVLLGAEVVLFMPKESEDAAVAEAKDKHRHSYVKAATPTVSLGYWGRVFAGTAPDIDMGGYSKGIVLLASGHMPFVDVHYDTNFLLNEQLDTGATAAGQPYTIRRAQFGETFSVDRPFFNPNLQFSAEVYHFSQPLVHATSSGLPVARASQAGFLFALGYQLRPNLVFDGGFEHGLTSTSTQWQNFVGFTYVLPHRLWPEHKAKS